ncbi:MAG: MBL fold metallo-hydrolase [Erysipelotrichaceae bacterium]|nr:MBL fold metallo-hydrolase [Erysipelotrichaceae bacterium]
MKYKVIASSSKGNCSIINGQIMIDIGLPYSRIKEHIKEVKLVLLTHIHSDHFKRRTIEKLSKEHPTVKFVCLEYLVNDLSQIIRKENIYVLEANKKYDVGIAKIAAFPLVHDVANCGWRIEINKEKCIYATDTSSLDGVVAKNYDLYLIEGNYDEKEIIETINKKKETGEFIYEYRAMNNHLSKQQRERWLLDNIGPESETVLMHEHVEKCDSQE